MICGIGVDSVEIARIEKAILKESFLNRIYTEAERQESLRAESMAARFAAKEAVVKALGCGFQGIRPNEVEVLHYENGAPYVRLTDHAEVKAAALGVEKVHLSISHDQTKAIAFVILEKGEQL